MELKYGIQLQPEALHQKEIDLFIFAGNHEGRVYTAYEYFESHSTIHKSIMLCYNEGYVADLHNRIELRVVSDQAEIFNILDSFFSNSSKPDPILFIDYSCMTKPWYYAIILYLSNRVIANLKVTCYFSYTPSLFSDPQEPKHNTEISPLPGKYIIPTDKPKALIVCLGYEQKKAEGIIDHLDPKLSYIYYTNPALDQQFVTVLEANNKYILSTSNNVTKYRFDDLLFLERELTGLYFALKDDYSIIIAPLGPKPFTFVSMLLSVKYPDIDIWRVGSGSDINEYTREPFATDCFILSETRWN